MPDQGKEGGRRRAAANPETYEEFMPEYRHLEKDLLAYKKDLAKREAQLDQERRRIEKEAVERERDFYGVIKEREAILDKREQEIHARQRDLERHIFDQQVESEAAAETLKQELKNKEKELIQMMQEVERDKELYREESRSRIASKSQEFVAAALSLLEKRNGSFSTFP